MQVSTLLPIVAVATVLAGIGGALVSPNETQETREPSKQQAWNPDLVRAYVDAGCWQCHSVMSLETQMREEFGERASGVRPFGPDLSGVGAKYSPGWQRAHLWDPTSVVGDSQMPAQRQLFDESDDGPVLSKQGEDVIKFLMTLNVPSEQTVVWPTAPQQMAHIGNPERGRVLFERNCVGCHGTDATGNGDAAVWLETKPANLKSGALKYRRNPDRATRDDVYTTIWNGLPMRMPSFAQKLTQHQVSDLTEFIFQIRESSDDHE